MRIHIVVGSAIALLIVLHAAAAHATEYCGGSGSTSSCRAYAEQTYTPAQSSVDGLIVVSQNAEDVFSPNNSHISKEMWLIFGSYWVEMGSKQGYMADYRLCQTNPCFFWEVPAYGSYQMATDYIGPSNPAAGSYQYTIEYNGATGNWDCWLDQGTGETNNYRGISRFSSFRYADQLQVGYETEDPANTIGSLGQTTSRFDQVSYRDATSGNYYMWPSGTYGDQPNVPAWPYVSQFIDPVSNNGDAQIVIQHT